MGEIGLREGGGRCEMKEGGEQSPGSLYKSGLHVPSRAPAAHWPGTQASTASWPINGTLKTHLLFRDRG